MTQSPEPAPYRYAPAAPTVEAGDALAVRAMRVFAFEYCEDLFWRVDEGILSVLVECSDVFMWGCADAEPITVENVAMLEATFAECEALFGKYNATWAGHLFVARVRGTRPQGAYYKVLEPAWVELFNAAGPVRETGPGNPQTPEQGQAVRAERDQRAAERAAEAAR